MTTLTTHDLEPTLLDELALIADPHTPLGKPFADKFRDACEAEAREHNGWVNPNRVRLRLLAEPDYNPRQYAALWSPACGRDGFLDKTSEPVQIGGEGSRGNGNKSTVWRKWRVGDNDYGWTEYALSDCEFGCKVYRHRDGLAADRTIHNSNYGCQVTK